MLRSSGDSVSDSSTVSRTVTLVDWSVPLDSHALVAYTSHGLALVYSLPHLEHIHTLQLRPDGFSE